MGQLEKYGLYVLCLLIFLILGVTLWGSGTVNAHKKDVTSATQHLKAATGKGNQNKQKETAGGDVEKHAARLPSFEELLSPKTPPKQGDDVGNENGEGNGKPADSPNPTPPQPGDIQTPPKTDPVAPADRPSYTIRRGDNYESIARELFNTRAMASEIARLNPRLDPRKLRPGKAIVIPTKVEAEAFLAQRASRRSGVKTGGKYTIRRGDTFTSIAIDQLGSRQRVKDIQTLNPGVDPTRMRVGTTILLPQR